MDVFGRVRVGYFTSYGLWVPVRVKKYRVFEKRGNEVGKTPEPASDALRRERNSLVKKRKRKKDYYTVLFVYMLLLLLLTCL
jgi:hypothetical protein